MLVAVNAIVLLLAGPAGAGKSTLAPAWCHTRLVAAHVQLDTVRNLLVQGPVDPQARRRRQAAPPRPAAPPPPRPSRAPRAPPRSTPAAPPARPAPSAGRPRGGSTTLSTSR